MLVKDVISTIENKTVVYIDDLKACNKFSKKIRPTWNEWLNLHLVCCEKRYLLKSAVYEQLKDKEVVDCWSDTIDSDDTVVIILKLEKDLIKAIKKEKNFIASIDKKKGGVHR